MTKGRAVLVDDDWDADDCDGMELPDCIYYRHGHYYEGLRETVLMAMGVVYINLPGETLVWGDFSRGSVDAGILELAGCIDSGCE